MNECTTDDPCLHGGVCQNTVGSYTCGCSDTGYEGHICETGKRRPVTNLPTKNHSTELENNYYWASEQVTINNVNLLLTDINECISGPCQNGGTCQNQVNRFRCVCSNTGFTGTTCEEGKYNCYNRRYKNPRYWTMPVLFCLGFITR